MKSLTYDIQHKEATVSTNDDVMALARAGANEGTVIVATTQSGGRGRLGGRVWESPRGGAYFSFLVRPSCGQEQVASLSPVVALAVHEALAGMGVESQLKYPNDVFVDGKKICGILLESGAGEDGTFVAIGVGINVQEPHVILSEAKDNEVILLRKDPRQDVQVANTVDSSLTSFAQNDMQGRFAYLANHVENAEPTLIDEAIGAVLGAFTIEYEAWQQECSLSKPQEMRYRSLLINPQEYR